jgi:pimeloyl-ACP methyl ester carboxylesterase
VNTATKHLVLLPGLDGSGLLFQPFLEQCLEKDQYTVIAYPNDYHIPYAELADYVASNLPKNKDIVLLGESYSGPVAIQLANKNELNISSLILVATFSFYPISILKFISLWLPYKYLLHLPVPDFLLKFMCFDENVDSVTMGLLKTSLTLTPPTIMAMRMSEGIHIDVRKELKLLTIPCTYIKAKHDKLVSIKASQEIKKINDAVKIIEIDGPHFILQTRITECCAVIKKII